ncbi:hypothetical protein HYX09_04755, partial [Candidatus Woesearchaeota archaeon]|nr:hypothetical protein [Candidatus Woesearchaeota archaeon]
MPEIWTPKKDIEGLIEGICGKSQIEVPKMTISRGMVHLQAFDKSAQRGDLGMEYDVSSLAVGGNESIDPAVLERKAVEWWFAKIRLTQYPIEIYYAESGSLAPLSARPEADAPAIREYRYFVNVQAGDLDSTWVHRAMREAIPELGKSEVVL